MATGRRWREIANEVTSNEVSRRLLLSASFIQQRVVYDDR